MSPKFLIPKELNTISNVVIFSKTHIKDHQLIQKKQFLLLYSTLHSNFHSYQTEH